MKSTITKFLLLYFFCMSAVFLYAQENKTLSEDKLISFITEKVSEMQNTDGYNKPTVFEVATILADEVLLIKQINFLTDPHNKQDSTVQDYLINNLLFRENALDTNDYRSTERNVYIVELNLDSVENMTINEIPERQPFIKSCSLDYTDFSELNKCSNERLLQLIGAHVKDYRKNKRKEVRAIMEYQIKSNGKFELVNVIGTNNEQIKKEMYRIGQLIQKDLLWSPGIQNGRFVHVQYRLPITFEAKK